MKCHFFRMFPGGFKRNIGKKRVKPFCINVLLHCVNIYQSMVFLTFSHIFCTSKVLSLYEKILVRENQRFSVVYINWINVIMNKRKHLPCYFLIFSSRFRENLNLIFFLDMSILMPHYQVHETNSTIWVMKEVKHPSQNCWLLSLRAPF